MNSRRQMPTVPHQFRNAHTVAIALLFGSVIALLLIYADSLPTKWQVALYVSLLSVALASLKLRHFQPVLFCLFVFFLPVEVGNSLFYDASRGMNFELRINVPSVLLFVLIAVFLLRRIIRKDAILVFPRTTIPATLFILLCVLSIHNAVDIMLSVFELFRLGIAFLIYLLTANYLSRERPNPNLLAVTVMTSLAVQSAIGILQHYAEGSIGLTFFGAIEMDPGQWGYEPVSRAGGLMGHPNALGGLILMLLPISIASYVYSDDARVRCYALLTSALSFFGLVVTYSRSAWMAFAVGASVSGLVWFVKTRQSTHSRRVQSMGVILILMLAVFLFSFSESIERRLFQDDYGSAASRVPMMVDAMEVIKHNYLLGVGLNNYPQVVPKYDVTGIHREWIPTVVHNLFLLIAAETGVLSLLLFLAFMYGVLRDTQNSRTADEEPLGRALAVAAKVGLALFLVFSVPEAAYRAYPGLQRVFWFLCGLVVGENAALRGARPLHGGRFSGSERQD